MNERHRNAWPKTPAGVWFGIVGGPAVWALQLLAGWWITEAACVDGDSGWGFLSASGVHWLQIGVAALAVLVVLLSLLTTWRHWHKAKEGAAERMEGWSRPDFMASFGLLMAGIFTVAMIWALISTLILPVCEAMR